MILYHNCIASQLCIAITTLFYISSLLAKYGFFSNRARFVLSGCHDPILVRDFVSVNAESAAIAFHLDPTKSFPGFLSRGSPWMIGHGFSLIVSGSRLNITDGWSVKRAESRNLGRLNALEFKKKCSRRRYFVLTRSRSFCSMAFLLLLELNASQLHIFYLFSLLQPDYASVAAIISVNSGHLMLNLSV